MSLCIGLRAGLGNIHHFGGTGVIRCLWAVPLEIV